MEKFKGALVVGALRLFALLPWRAVQGVGAGIGWLMWKLPNRSREVVRINLSKCFPELSETELEKLVGQSLMEILAGPSPKVPAPGSGRLKSR